MNKFLSFAALAAGLSLSVAASAQEQATTASSNGSYRPIPNSDIMFRKTIWRAIDLREKQNKPMFSEGREISGIIMDAVKRGELQAYTNDSLTTTLSAAEMMSKMSYQEAAAGLSDEEKAAGFSNEATDDWGAPVKKGSKAAAAPAAPASYAYRPKEIYQMELKEDMIFDKKRSRMYHDIKSLTLLVPSTLSGNTSGIERPIGSFKYSDLVRVFRANPDKAIWFNPQNDAQHKNLADAFELWLFNSYIVKVSNPTDSRLDEIYGSQQQGILASQQAAADLIEYEYNLWSF
ncbi:type IX secretion system ring subunit PorN/GldN [Hymenobacter actinosclerus]|uniref:Gliding motility associated protien GldN n=1 Tax=Hymenobacter actinosclerus TaxID=82805 RepID=A0A1H9Z8C0_9BACT|nr:gliding motility protein GldN [Hymenobacter actinosclerus]SES77723.1 gliding motility associated protien GldN [Hymenobacter actinosclerus]